MRNKLFVLLFCSLLMVNVSAQFSGPSVAGRATAVEQVRGAARLGSYVMVTGHIAAHQRSDYATFRDKTGEIRVVVESPVWQGRAVTPDTKVRLLAEVDRGFSGRYLWVKSLELLE